jgi:2-dehydro-3-deoxygluconokinase
VYDLVTFGEVMVRLSPPGYKRIEQTDSMDVHVGGTELNVAVGAGRFGLSTAWVSKLPDNPLGRLIRNKAREQGVNTSHLVWEKEGRAGLYFIELGATPRASSVVYDRADSSFSRIQAGEVNWEAVLANAKCLHITGITPAVSISAKDATWEALIAAKKSGCKVSFDLNYRKKLWSPENAQKTIIPMMEYVDILIATIGDARVMLGIDENKESSLSDMLMTRFPLEVVAVSIRRGTSVLTCDWSAVARNKDTFHEAREYHVDIVDQVGRGDAFAAGFLSGYLPNGDVQKGLDYGVAFSALKHSIPGDMNWCTKEEVEALLAGPAPGVSR